MRFLLYIFLLVGIAYADVYLHSPRGSNNRLNEKSATRTTNNRLFDSQNNARGGYNAGDATKAKATDYNGQFHELFYQSGTTGKSYLTIEWTNQHGCGGNDLTDPHKQNCDVVIQTMCQPYTSSETPDDDYTIRNGLNTNRQQFDNKEADATEAEINQARQANVANDRGLNEGWDFYNACRQRQRNKGLFTADQQLTSDSATNTRQNPNGQNNRNGYECPEERDYYPYWHPTPFVDVAVLTDDTTKCGYYKQKSFNLNPKHECVETFSANVRKPFSVYNNEADCAANGGVWTAYHQYIHIDTSKTAADCAGTRDGFTYIWAKPYDTRKIQNHEVITEACLARPEQVVCQQAPWTRSNHLGNGRDGVPGNFTWTIPRLPDNQRCILRIRYNISTDDYDPYTTDSNSNGNASPVTNNPVVNVGANSEPLRLALNTQQTGRTFQDRTHVFILKKRSDESIPENARIYNVNVRGKRGNIVQTFPAVEYDFIPNKLNIKPNDLVHFQWAGSNTHNNGAPGGDGQTGNAGEGTDGTDRQNMVQIPDANANFPNPIESINMFDDAVVVWEDSPADVTTITPFHIALRLASSGEYRCKESTDVACGGDENYSIEGRSKLLDGQLNDAPASYRGMLIKFTKQGTFHYMCSRNNNFTNRSQKAKITIAR